MLSSCQTNAGSDAIPGTTANLLLNLLFWTSHFIFCSYETFPFNPVFFFTTFDRNVLANKWVVSRVEFKFLVRLKDKVRREVEGGKLTEGGGGARCRCIHAR